MKVKAKCHNYSGCLLAYRGEEIELEPGAALVCPDCGKPVTISKGGGGVAKWIVGAILLGAMAAGAYVGLPYLFKDRKATSRTEGPTPSQAVRSGNASIPVRPSVPSKDPKVGVAAEPPKEIVAPATLNLNDASAESQQVKTEVLKRIDIMPNLSQANKDKLYSSVERARSMARVLTIPFGSGKTTLSPSDLQSLKTHLEAPAMVNFMHEEPTAVFVILGYADPKGDEKKNIEFSQARADSVLAAMRDKCGVQNVMHAVAMGGSTLLDASNLEKNRIVEVWAVLP
jgi:outer membrane protein OmpA-like peptidoglycan-associated protein